MMYPFQRFAPGSLEKVIACISPQDCARPDNIDRYCEAVQAAADHCRASMHKFADEALGDVQERKRLMLREGVRFRNEWFAKEPA